MRGYGMQLQRGARPAKDRSAVPDSRRAELLAPVRAQMDAINAANRAARNDTGSAA